MTDFMVYGSTSFYYDSARGLYDFGNGERRRVYFSSEGKVNCIAANLDFLKDFVK